MEEIFTTWYCSSSHICWAQFPCILSFCILGPVHISPSSCYEEPAALPLLLSAIHIGDPSVNPIPVSPVITVPKFSCPTKLSYSCASDFPFQLHLLIIFLVMSTFVNTTMALPTYAQLELSVCALNTNGLMSLVKLAFIGPLIMKLAPHFFALSETKTQTNAALNLQISNYEVF